MPLYIGNPVGNLGIRTMPYAPRGFATPLSSAETEHALAGGGTTITKRARARRRFTYQWKAHDFTVDTAEELSALYLGVHGPGPYVLLGPEQRNFAPQAVGSFGASGGAPGWAASAGTYTANVAGIALPTGVISGVGTWGGAGNGSILSGTPVVSVIDPALGCVLVPNVACTISCWLKVASSTATLTLAAFGGSSGAGTSQAASSATAIGTTWTRLSATIAAAATPVAYIYPRVLCGTASAPTIHLAGCQIEYATAAAAFVQPLGTPRVVIPAGVGIDVDVLPYRGHTLTLAEV
jgi:hypothetical protein